ncbi:MAG: HlyD family efflux transporter periplasmic adaptor subunit [Planctomycetaceae bacterium]|nr:HlyD family efflux transporter periplasmic adaptor subunit [Planctomycetaceae bacterium]
MSGATRSLVVVLPALLLAGCDMAAAPVERAKAPRPVTVLELQRTAPRPTNQLTGSIVAWKTEQMGFQVAGRVELALEPGQNIRGRTVDENDKLISNGTVVARLERDRFDLKLAVAEAQENTAVATAKAKNAELNDFVPAQIKAAQASVTVTKTEFGRVEKLFQRGAATQAELDRAKANLDTKQAELEQAAASKSVTAAELVSLEAQKDEAAENVLQAKKDLIDTLLQSPFHGQIAEVHQIPGGYVQAGEPVVTIQMMDPISVEIAVSAETDARLNYNDIVSVFMPGSDEPMEAMVYEKATVADAATRTFKVTLLVRNERIEVGLPDGERNSTTPRVRMLVRLFTETRARVPPYYVNVDSLHQDAEGYFVYRVTNATQTNRSELTDSKIRLQKVRVTPGEKRLPYLQVATMRELTDLGELDPKNDLLAGTFFRSDGSEIPNKDVAALLKESDGTVPYVREMWLLRPGDIMRVDLDAATPTAGFYVPLSVILEESGKTYVFVAETTGQTSNAKRVEVHVLDVLGTTRRIKAAGKAPFKAGTTIVADGALFLTDGETVTVIEKTGASR